MEFFLTSNEGLQSKGLGLQRLESVNGTGSGIVEAASEGAASSGRWVKLSSAHAVEEYGLRES